MVLQPIKTEPQEGYNCWPADIFSQSPSSSGRVNIICAMDKKLIHVCAVEGSKACEVGCEKVGTLEPLEGLLDQLAIAARAPQDVVDAIKFLDTGSSQLISIRELKQIRLQEVEFLSSEQRKWFDEHIEDHIQIDSIWLDWPEVLWYAFMKHETLAPSTIDWINELKYCCVPQLVEKIVFISKALDATKPNDSNYGRLRDLLNHSYGRIVHKARMVRSIILCMRPYPTINDRLHEVEME
jgi:hypothetical protein